jgi:PAS domain S-box-containing protein
MNNSARNRFILLVTIGYAVFALVWIFLSDQLLSLFGDIRSILWLSTAKGVFFVVVTATLLFFALRVVPPAGDDASRDLIEMLAAGIRPIRQPRWVAYLLALVLTTAMLVVRLLITTSFESRPLLILFMFPIIISALLGGVGPGLLATALATIGVRYLAIPPLHSFRIGASHDLVQWFFLVVNGIAVSLLSEMLHRAQIRAEASRRMLDSIVSGTTDAVFVKDTGGRYLLANEAASRFVGKSNAEIIGHDDLRLFPKTTAEEIMAIDRAIMAGGQVISLEERVVIPDGREVVFLVTKGPLLDEGGHLLGVFGISREITDRKRAEEEIHELNAELERKVTERTHELRAANAELEELAYTLTHNLCSPLRAMGGFSHLLLHEDADQLSLEVRGGLIQIREAAATMGKQLEGILTLLRCSRVELHPERIDISALARQLLGRLAKVEPERRVRWEVEEGIVATYDRNMLETVLTHLLKNAWKFTCGREDASIRVFGDNADGRYAVCVADNGAGFDMAHAGRLFHPFQRLHRQDEFPGIGIGLATVQRIVHRHGGTINVEGAPGRGATFRFTLGTSEVCFQKVKSDGTE